MWIKFPRPRSMGNSQTAIWDSPHLKPKCLFAKARPNWNQSVCSLGGADLEEVSALLFCNSCQLFLPARSRRPSWFSPLNQILRGAERERKGRWKSKNKPCPKSFPLWRQKEAAFRSKRAVISGTRPAPCRLHARVRRPHRPGRSWRVGHE